MLGKAKRNPYASLVVGDCWGVLGTNGVADSGMCTGPGLRCRTRCTQPLPLHRTTTTWRRKQVFGATELNTAMHLVAQPSCHATPLHPIPPSTLSVEGECPH